MNRNLATFISAGAVVVMTAGCASTAPTVGDLMTQQSESTRELAMMWERGNDMVAKGEKVKAEGQEIVANGEAKVREGDRMIAEGNRIKQESEMLYKERFPGKSLEVPVKEAPAK